MFSCGAFDLFSELSGIMRHAEQATPTASVSSSVSGKERETIRCGHSDSVGTAADSKESEKTVVAPRAEAYDPMTGESRPGKRRESCCVM